MTRMILHAYPTMAEAVRGLRKRGFSADFTISPETGEASAAGRSFKAEDLTIVEHHRFEGISDPDDSSVLFGIEGSDGTKGLLVDAYGVYADPGIAEVLRKVRTVSDAGPVETMTGLSA